MFLIKYLMSSTYLGENPEYFFIDCRSFAFEDKSFPIVLTLNSNFLFLFGLIFFGLLLFLIIFYFKFHNLLFCIIN